MIVRVYDSSIYWILSRRVTSTGFATDTTWRYTSSTWTFRGFDTFEVAEKYLLLFLFPPFFLLLLLGVSSFSSSSSRAWKSKRVVARYPINSLDRVGEEYDNLRIRDLGLAVYTSPPSFFLFLRRRRASSFPSLRPRG